MAGGIVIIVFLIIVAVSMVFENRGTQNDSDEKEDEE